MTVEAAAVVGPSISVVVATIEPWPTVRPCLDRLLPQVLDAGGELILGDGSPGGCGAPPASESAYGAIRTFCKPGDSVFALRAHGAGLAAGPVVAFTEDHCIVGPRWVRQLLDTHRAHPGADMIAGAVTNGSADGLVDWANFLMTFAEFMPPAPARPLIRTPPMGNASFTRRVLPEGAPPEGWLEVVLAPTLQHQDRLRYDDAIQVGHVQPRRLRAALAAHFNNGRACAGLALPHIAKRDWMARLVRLPRLPFYLRTSVLRSIEGRQIPARARRSLSLLMLLCVAHAAGEGIGLCFGEGRSAKRLN